MPSDGIRRATRDVGSDDLPVVFAIHGFASSADRNWFATGWIRELVRAGFRVVAFDQRGHSSSHKPRVPEAYSMERLVGGVQTVLDTCLIDETFVVG